MSENGIGWAVKEMLNGSAITRKGWNGKDMFVYYVKGNEYLATSPVAKQVWGDNGLVPYLPYVAMKTVQNNVVPWLCSQSDLLATDWEIYNV